MRLHRPTAPELIAAVQRLLDQATPASAYERRVASHVLEMLAREFAQRTAAAQVSHARLAEFLQTSGPPDALHRQLCDQIALGAFDARPRALLALLRADTLAQLAIDNPRYPAYLRAMADPATSPAETPP